MAELLIGCGASREKRVWIGDAREWTALVTLDISPATNPDVGWDLNRRPLPFDDDTFEEVHAYEVLEHIGRQGDARGFFAEFSEYWRILKPGGVFIATVPLASSPWAWGDPGHTRVISPQTLLFLDRTNYGRPPMTDYRHLYAGDFEIIMQNRGYNGTSLAFCLRAVKPARLT